MDCTKNLLDLEIITEKRKKYIKGKLLEKLKPFERSLVTPQIKKLTQEIQSKWTLRWIRSTCCEKVTPANRQLWKQMVLFRTKSSFKSYFNFFPVLSSRWDLEKFRRKIKVELGNLQETDDESSSDGNVPSKWTNQETDVDFVIFKKNLDLEKILTQKSWGQNTFSWGVGSP